MIRRGNEFCASKGLKFKPQDVTVTDKRSSLKTAVALVETVMTPAGNIEMIFTCAKE